MIRNTLAKTQSATFSILLPDEQKHGMPSPCGTGFFISADGYFVTAAHVVTKKNSTDGEPREDIDNAVLEKEIDYSKGFPPIQPMCQSISLEYINLQFDFALLKVDFEKNKEKQWLEEKENFPHLTISKRQLEVAEPVYSFGYPLSASFAQNHGHAIIGSTELCPRVTSAIVSSTLEKTKMIMSPNDPKIYVLDKALNYGNSGGPIVSVDTGMVHAYCSRFQPVFVPQPFIKDQNGNQLPVMLPSLYGIITSLHNTDLLAKFEELGIQISDS